MSKREAPKHDAEHYAARHNRIIAAARAAGIRKGPLALLRALLDGEDWNRRTVIRSREWLAERVGCDVRTVERNMPVLVAAGAVVKLYDKGGKGKANIYRCEEIRLNIRQNVGPKPEPVDNSPSEGAKPPTFCRDTSDKMSDPSNLSLIVQKGSPLVGATGRGKAPVSAGGDDNRDRQAQVEEFRQKMRGTRFTSLADLAQSLRAG